MQTSSGVRMSNIFNASRFEEVEGYNGLGLSMGQPICQSVRALRLHSFENNRRYNLGLTLLIKGDLILFRCIWS